MSTRQWIRLPTSFGGRAAEYSGTGHDVYAGMSFYDVVVVDFITGHPRRVVIAGVLVP
jgi:hypothetical protein